MENEFKLYGQPNCSIFTIIGDGETAQTKCLAYLLYKSKKSVKALIDLLNSKSILDKNKIPNLSKYHYIVDAELRQNLQENKSYRADIVLRFYDEFNYPIYAIAIEAKSKGKRINEEHAVEQIKNYSLTFDELVKPFKDKISLVTLTDIISINQVNSVISISWCDIINALEKINEDLVKEYINYLLKINGNMKQYDKEILSVPAGGSQDIINETNIYTCPASNSGKYKFRAQCHPQFIACREKGSIIRRIFKLHKNGVIKLSLPLADEVKPYLIDVYGPSIIERLEKWNPKDGKTEEKYVFIFDENETIVLPTPIQFVNGNSYDKELSFKEVFNKTDKSIIKI